jgi:hypothetical protein
LQRDGDDPQPRDGDDAAPDVAEGQDDGTMHDIVEDQVDAIIDEQCREV